MRSMMALFLIVFFFAIQNVAFGENKYSKKGSLALLSYIKVKSGYEECFKKEIKEHLASPPLADYLKRTAPFLAEPAKLVKFTPVDN